MPPRAVRDRRDAAAVRRDAYGVPVGVLYGGEPARGRELHGVALPVRDGISAPQFKDFKMPRAKSIWPILLSLLSLRSYLCSIPPNHSF